MGQGMTNGLEQNNDTAHSVASSLNEKTTTDLSIIVVSYNTVALLRKCLNSIYAHPHSEWQVEVIVVDNASHDGSAEMVRAEFPPAHLIANEANLGFARANNQALELAIGQYILLLNPDTELLDEAVWKMLAFLQATPNVAVVGPALLYPDGSYQEGSFRFPSLLQIFFDFFPLNWRLTRSRLNGRYPRQFYQGEHPEPFEIDFPLGACLMVKQSVVQTIGKLDEHFFMYMEEIDWCYRIKAAGTPQGYGATGFRFRAGRRQPHHWQIYCLPSAKIIHHAGASSRQFRDEMFYQLHKSRAYFYQKHYSPPFQFGARWLTRIGLGWLTLQATFGRIRGKMSRDDYNNRLRAYRRVWGLRETNLTPQPPSLKRKGES